MSFSIVHVVLHRMEKLIFPCDAIPVKPSSRRRPGSPNAKQRATFKTLLSLPIILFSFFLSCGNKSSEKKFFDVPGYFRGEIEVLRKSSYVVSKTSVYNTDTSRQKMKASEMNWEKEFAIFLECDINKPVYYANMRFDYYKTDSISSRTTYTSVSKKTGIQKMVIDSGMGKPTMVSIELVKTNLISNTEITAAYFHGHRYFIDGKQSIKQLGEKNEFWVEGIFN